MQEKQKIAWVIGAGFSQPLGAPLLRDFFSEQALEDSRRWFREQLSGDEFDDAYYLYQWGMGRKLRETARDPQALWRNAEEFLDRLDNACRAPKDSKAWQRMSQKIDASGGRHLKQNGKSREYRLTEVDKVYAAARRMLAAECITFLKEVDLGTEPWKPYLHWAANCVQLQDSVITFNYDRVPDIIRSYLDDNILNDGAGKRMQAKYYLVVPPEPPEFRRPLGARLLKLHGGVDGSGKDDGAGTMSFFLHEDPDYAMSATDDMVLATPGPSKLATATSLDALWISAEDALREADAIVFVGYRFPPTDTEACRRLIGAIRANEQPYVAIHTVLGPEVNNLDQRRLQELLKFALQSAGRAKRGPRSGHVKKTYDVIAQPFFAQDFLTFFDRNLVISPHAE